MVTFYPQQDHEGSVTHLTNSSGAVIEKYRYDAFGAPTIYNASNAQLSTSAYNNRFLFTGREYASTFSIYEYRARAYHPTLGRFMSEDPKGFVRHVGLGAATADWSFSAHPDEGEYNLYRYCGNDPLDFTDPLGLEFTDLDPQLVESIPGRYGETAFKGNFAVGVVSSASSGFDLKTIKFDVTVIRKQIATTADGLRRTQDAIKATMEHENKHVSDIKRWYDSNQERALGHFKTREAAENNAEGAAKKIYDQFGRAQNQSQQHEPKSAWKRIMDRERATLPTSQPPPPPPKPPQLQGRFE